MNQMKAHLSALSLLDRAVHALTDAELRAILDALEPEAAEAVAQAIDLDDLATDDAVDATRAAAVKGRINGVLQQLGVVLSDRCLTDCIEVLGDSADNPTEDELRAASLELVERHGVGAVRLMLASAVVGEAPASVACVRMLKHDAVFALPPVELRARKQAEARARREQAERARHRS